jgi:glycosyltransferase involved in cell wall biosynthesis
MDRSTLERMVVLCDERTRPDTAPDHVRVNPCWRMNTRGEALQIAEQIERSNPDAVVIQHQEGMISFLDAAELISDERVRHRVTVIVMHNAVNLPSAGDDLETVLDGLRKASRVVVHTLEDVNLLRHYGLSENVTLLPPGADCASTIPPIRDVSRRHAAPMIGSTGFFLAGKGIDRLIHATARLRRKWPKIRLRLANAILPREDSTQEAAACRALAHKLRIAGAIDWHPNFLPQHEVWRLLGDCDLVVLPYPERTDSVSGAVRLAMASQVPVLVTRVKMFAELDNGRDIVGWVESNAPDVLARGMAGLLTNTGKRGKIQQNARDWLTGFTWADAAKQLEDMVAGLVAAKRAETVGLEGIELAGAARL